MSTEWPLNMDLWVTMDITHVCRQFTEMHSCAQQSHVHGLWPEMHLCAQWTVYRDALLHSGITWTWALTRDTFMRSTRRCFTGHFEYWYSAAQTCADGTLSHYKWTFDYILSSNGLQYGGEELVAWTTMEKWAMSWQKHFNASYEEPMEDLNLRYHSWWKLERLLKYLYIHWNTRMGHLNAKESEVYLLTLMKGNMVYM